MSYISDFKSSAISIFKQGTSLATGTGIVAPELSAALGQRFALNDGREVVIVSNSATALTTGVLVQGEPITANHQNLAVAVTSYPATAGLFQISVTLGATLLKTNQYAGGYAIVNAGTGIGQTLRIASHLNAAASAAGVIINLEDPIQITLDATSKVCLIPNPYKNVVINPTTFTNTPVGVTITPVAASVAPTTNGTSGLETAPGTAQYAFVQTRGVVSLLNDSNTAVGLGISPSAGAAGAFITGAATTARIGRALQAGVTAEARAVFIEL